MLGIEDIHFSLSLFLSFSHTKTVKLPFPLTLRFKRMLQSGIETPDMDVTWVSSISWYFLNLFGLNAIYRLVLGEGNGEFFQRMKVQLK